MFYFDYLRISIHSNVPPLVSLSVFVNIYNTMSYIYYVKAGRQGGTVTVSLSQSHTESSPLDDHIWTVVLSDLRPPPRPRPQSHQAIRQNYLLMAFYMINHLRGPVFSVIKLEILSFDFEKLIYIFLI